MKRSQVDEAIVARQLMRFPDKADARDRERPLGRTKGPMRLRPSPRQTEIGMGAAGFEPATSRV